MMKTDADKQFRQYLSNHVSLEDHKIKAFCDLYQLRQFSKKDLFFQQGSIANKEGFVLSGLWIAITEAGSIVVSDEVKLICEIQFVKQN
jgi:hypothetical protein